MDIGLIERAGRVVQVVGDSGSGLSLLARHLHERLPRVAVMRQDAVSHVSYLRATVIEEVCIGLEQRGVPRAEMRRRAGEMLARAGLDGLAERDPATLSGGETRRLAFACVAILEPDTLVLDDPFAGLDAASARRIAGVLRESAARVVLLGHQYVEAVGGQSLSLLDATLTASPPPRRTFSLPGRVAPTGGELDCGLVGARRGRKGQRFVLDPVRVVARPGAVVWLRGENGSGKTSLLRALAGLDGAPAPAVPAALALQRAADQVAETTLADFLGSAEAARELGLDPEEHPLDLSARDLRLAQLAQAFGQGRPLVLLDEPDVGLDAPGRAAAHERIAQGLRGGAAVVLTCHDEAFVAEVGRYADVVKLGL